MTRVRLTQSICGVLITLMTAQVVGQFKETYEQPGYLLQWGSSGSGNNQFNSPYGVAVDRSGNVYVADSLNYRIQKFDSAGNFMTRFGTLQGDGWVGGASGVAVDGSGNVYVVGEPRIQKFDSAGNFLTTWGTYGAGDGQFSYPTDVAVNAFGNLYVADFDNQRIQKFDSVGNFLAKWGSYGSGDGQFKGPGGVAVDIFGNVYVSDRDNHRIQKFDSVGNLLTKWGSEGSGDGQFDKPFGIAVDAFGNVYVSDLDNHRIQKFDSAGNFLTKWGGNGSGDSQFLAPYGVAADLSGNVYVGDRDNSRIQKFALASWFDVAGYDSYLSVAAQHEVTAVRTLFGLENNGAPRFALKNTNSDVEWSFQQSGPGNFLISNGGTGGPEMQVYQTGRVRMGPGGVANFDLDGNGNLTVKGSLTANGSAFPDYVFEPDYELMPLESVAEYIEREKRLPGIPSAKEVQEQGGHNMTELQLKLLEKIEELTLYTLDQERLIGEREDWIRRLRLELKIIREVPDEERRSK